MRLSKQMSGLPDARRMITNYEENHTDRTAK
jgi:hypothetical protein